VRAGVRLGVDVGSVRVGVAACDPAGLMATPVETVRRGTGDLARLAQLATEYEAVELVVGLPLSLSGAEGQAALAAREFAGRLAAAVGVPVRLVDERLSTVDATRTLRDAGLAGKRQRGVIDQAAAVIILQGALDQERSSGLPPGEPVPTLNDPVDQGEA
jgi:putative holliday junction resolvase